MQMHLPRPRSLRALAILAAMAVPAGSVEAALVAAADEAIDAGPR